jgi:hypothetical protein
METQDIIGKEFEFFRYNDVPHLKWGDEYSKWIGSRCVVLSLHDRHPHAALAEVYPPIGMKFTKHFPTEQIKEQLEKIELENKSTEELLNDMKQLISRL